MKIALVFDNMIFGGIERVGVSYVGLLKEMGHEVDAYVLNPKTEKILDELSELCDVKVLNFKKTKCSEAYWGAAIKYSWGVVALPFLYYGMKLLQPIFKSIYGNKKEYDIAIAFSGHYNDLTFVGEEYIKAKKKIAWLHGAEYEYHLLSPGYGRLYPKIKNLVCLSELCDGECLKYNTLNHITKTKIYNPIVINKSVDEEKVQDLKKKYGDFCLMVARLAKDKDQKTAIKALDKLNKKFEQNKKLLLVGDGELRSEIEHFVKTMKMEDDVIFIGAVSDVQNYYAAATTYVHSSPLEGLPTVLLEAMSFGLPISATDSIPGVREILGDNKCGLISPVMDDEGLAENLYKLYTDSELCKNLTSQAKVKLEEFSPENVKVQITELFTKLMNE